MNKEHQTVQPYLFGGSKETEVSDLASFYIDLTLDLFLKAFNEHI